MKDSEREELVKDLQSYVAMMAPHQQERMGGKLILRCLSLLDRLRVIELFPEDHAKKLLDDPPAIG